MPFQTSVRSGPAPAVEGDFASSNPRSNILAGPSGLVTGAAGVLIARFGWLSSQFLDGDDAPAVVNNFGAGAPNGFVHRENQALITGYLEESGMRIIPGVQVTLHDAGDFWIKNRGTTYAQVGQKVFASNADGSAAAAAAGASIGGSSGAASSIAAATNAFTGAINDNLLTVSAVSSGTIYPGTTIAGTGVATGTQIAAQQLPLLAGEALGGVGRYRVSIPGQAVASTAMTGTYGVLTVGGSVTGGTFGAGQAITGTNVPAGTTIRQQLTGTQGGAGTYVVDNNTVVASTAISSSNFSETKWFVASPAAVGELMKMTTRTPR